MIFWRNSFQPLKGRLAIKPRLPLSKPLKTLKIIKKIILINYIKKLNQHYDKNN